MKSTFIALAAALLHLASNTALAEEWTRFRGPNGTGIAPPLAIPDTDYAWQIDLPGGGHGSPVVWGDRLFLTSGDADSGDVFLEAYDATTGKHLWRGTHRVEEYEKHLLNAIASTTPAVDDKHVYTTFYTPGNVTLVAYTHEGTEAWRVELGEFSCEHGFSASPIVVGEVVCLQGDTKAGGYLVALDAKTGKERWRATRAAGNEVYATPAVMTLADGREAIVYSSTIEGLTAVDAANGDKLWQTTDGLPERTVSSPIIAGDMVLAACGSGGSGKQMMAIRVKDNGEVEPAYNLRRNVPYVPTGIVVGDLLFLIHDRGTFTCVELKTGEELWTKRLGGKYYCSPILLGDRLLCVSMDGEAIVLAAGREFEELGRTDLGDGTHATPAVAAGRLFIRTESKLFCLAE